MMNYPLVAYLVALAALVGMCWKVLNALLEIRDMVRDLIRDVGSRVARTGLFGEVDNITHEQRRQGDRLLKLETLAGVRDSHS